MCSAVGNVAGGVVVSERAATDRSRDWRETSPELELETDVADLLYVLAAIAGFAICLIVLRALDLRTGR